MHFEEQLNQIQICATRYRDCKATCEWAQKIRTGLRAVRPLRKDCWPSAPPCKARLWPNIRTQTTKAKRQRLLMAICSRSS